MFWAVPEVGRRRKGGKEERGMRSGGRWKKEE